MEQGEELEEDIDARNAALITKAMAERHLTRAEEEREQEKMEF